MTKMSLFSKENIINGYQCPKKFAFDKIIGLNLDIFIPNIDTSYKLLTYIFLVPEVKYNKWLSIPKKFVLDRFIWIFSFQTLIQVKNH